MFDLSSIGKWVVLTGMILAAIGLFMGVAGKFPFAGRLPGDLYFEGQNFKFYLPLTTYLLLSMVGSLVLWIFSKFK
ncbi:MAG TPA: DUF2905 domain-containing protein [bacterium]|nr:DUF2905 domain-containing protein [bacterium]